MLSWYINLLSVLYCSCIGCLKLVELVCDSFHDLVLRLVKVYFLINCFYCVAAVFPS